MRIDVWYQIACCKLMDDVWSQEYCVAANAVHLKPNIVLQSSTFLTGHILCISIILSHWSSLARGCFPLLVLSHTLQHHTLFSSIAGKYYYAVPLWASLDLTVRNSSHPIAKPPLLNQTDCSSDITQCVLIADSSLRSPAAADHARAYLLHNLSRVNDAFGAVIAFVPLPLSSGEQKDNAMVAA